MKSTPPSVQLKLIGDARVEKKPAAASLLNHHFFDGRSSVRVIAVCQTNPSQVVVEREIDGKRWTISAGLVRLIAGRERRRKIA